MVSYAHCRGGETGGVRHKDGQLRGYDFRN